MEEEAGRILLIEDDLDHAELVLGCLAEVPVKNQVLHLQDGEAAMDYLLQRGAYSDPATNARPLLILLDLRLPRIDGLEVLRQIKADPSLKRIPLIILTTSDAEKDVVQAYDLHANSYLVKPINFEQFDKLMQDLTCYWLVWNRQPRS